MRSIAKIMTWPVTFGITIAVLTYGWGLEPQSWWWIIGGHLATVVVAVLPDLIPE